MTDAVKIDHNAMLLVYVQALVVRVAIVDICWHVLWQTQYNMHQHDRIYTKNMDDLDEGFLRQADTSTNMLQEIDEEHLLLFNTQSHEIDVPGFDHNEAPINTDVNAGYSEQSDCTEASMAVTEIDMSWEPLLVLAPDSESFDTTSTNITPDETAVRESDLVNPLYQCGCQMNGRACMCNKEAIRMLKNRASAQKSRSIKAHKLVHMQEELACYKRTCDALRTQNDLLKVQNAELRAKQFTKSLL